MKFTGNVMVGGMEWLPFISIFLGLMNSPKNRERLERREAKESEEIWFGSMLFQGKGWWMAFIVLRDEQTGDRDVLEPERWL